MSTTSNPRDVLKTKTWMSVGAILTHLGRGPTAYRMVRDSLDRMVEAGIVERKRSQTYKAIYLYRIPPHA